MKTGRRKPSPVTSRALTSRPSPRRPPHAHGAVAAGGGDTLAAGKEQHTGRRLLVAPVLAQLLAALAVPDAHLGVAADAAGDQAAAVGRKRDAEAFRHAEPPYL